MSVFSVSLIVQSSRLSSSEVAELIGQPPDGTAEIGELVGRNVDALRRDTSWCKYATRLDDPNLAAHMNELQPLLRRLGEIDEAAGLRALVHVGVEARQTGVEIGLPLDVLDRLCDARCEIVFDCYDSLREHPEI